MANYTSVENGEVEGRTFRTVGLERPTDQQSVGLREKSPFMGKALCRF